RFTAASPIISLAITDATAIGITDGTRSLRVGDRLWFVTNTGTQGTELWKLESTTFTTFDVLAGSSSSNPADLVDVNGALYFTATTGASGARELWRSIGGAAPTRPAGQPFVNPGELIKAGAFVAFSAQPSAGSADREVFSYNGTTFVQLSNIADSNNTSSSPSFLTFFGGRVFFAATDGFDGQTSVFGIEGRELYAATPGVANSATTPFANIGQPDLPPLIFPTPFGTFTLPGQVVGSNPAYLSVAGAALYFSATNGSAGPELWRTDGVDATAAHTGQVKDIVPGSAR